MAERELLNEFMNLYAYYGKKLDKMKFAVLNAAFRDMPIEKIRAGINHFLQNVEYLPDNPIPKLIDYINPPIEPDEFLSSMRGKLDESAPYNGITSLTELEYKFYKKYNSPTDFLSADRTSQKFEAKSFLSGKRQSDDKPKQWFLPEPERYPEISDSEAQENIEKVNQIVKRIAGR